jgi:hypothetical protein
MKTVIKEFVLCVSFYETDSMNNPGYWGNWEGAPLLSYKGDPITEKELLKLIEKGGLVNVMAKEDASGLSALEDIYNLENLGRIAKRSSTLDEFVNKASKSLWKSSQDDLYNCCHVLDEGRHSVPYFEDYYYFSYEIK